MNSFNGIGRIGMDPELKDVGGGHQKLGLRVAFNRRVKVDGSWTEKASWVSVTLWDKRATALEPYLRKGTQIGVEGELDVHEYEKRDGGKGVEVRIENANVHLLGKGDGGQKRSEFSGGAGGGGGNDFPANDFGDDEIPFAFCGDVAKRDHMRGAWVK